MAYDRNGNIKELKRYGEQDERLYLWDDLAYTYTGNRLQAVQDAGEGETGFVDGASTATEYNYDASGNMTRDDNKGISSITYDPVLNLPTEVVITGKGTIKYTYDAAGIKLRQEVLPTDGSPTKTTDYVSGFHYTDGQLDFIQHEEGRLMVKDGLAYHYDLKDHLGNTRVTFSDTPITTTAMATMEASAAPVEEAVFEEVAESRQTLAFHNTTEASPQEPQPNKVATLMPGQQGPTKSVQVHAGDTVRLKVNARYETVPSQVQGLEGVATEVAGALEKTVSGLESGGVSDGLNGLAAGSALATGKDQEVPQAYLNYLLYDENYQLVDQGFQQISKAAAVGKSNPSATPEELALEVPIAEEGYLYTYLSNEPDASSSAVYFDDFTVEQQSYIVQVDDYYPFGAAFDQSAGRVLENKYLYQGQELQNTLGLGWYQFKWRMHDPALGRFISVDPLAHQYTYNSPYAFAENRVPSGRDLEGLEYAPPLMPGENSGFVPDGRAMIEQARANIEVLKVSDLNDATVLATALTRDGNAINVDNTPASGSDIGFAAAGAIIPFVSGSAVKKLGGVLGELLIDTNVIISDGKKFAESAKNVIKDVVSDLEINNLVDRGKLKGKPTAADQIISVESSKDINSRINVRGEIRKVEQSKGKTPRAGTFVERNNRCNSERTKCNLNYKRQGFC